MKKGILSNKWSTLSGGERQRAVMATAFILALSLTYTTKENCFLVNPLVVTASTISHSSSADAVVLLLDEPTAACDAETTVAIEELLRQSKLSIIMITHNNQQALRLANRRIVFK